MVASSSVCCVVLRSREELEKVWETVDIARCHMSRPARYSEAVNRQVCRHVWVRPTRCALTIVIEHPSGT